MSASIVHEGGALATPARAEASTAGREALAVRGVTVTYDTAPVLEDVTFTLQRGLLAGIVGPNGAGKSTLLKAMLGLVPRQRGELTVLGERDAAALRHLVYVPQRSAVDWDFPVTVRDVVAQGRYRAVGLFRRFSRDERAAVDEAMQLVGLSELAARQIGELSGGQQQRVFLARALAQRGDVVLMDEPFASVDAATEHAILLVLQRLRDEGRTVVVVHHDLATVQRYFDWLVLLNRRVVACGPTREVFTREHLQRAYGGKLAVLDGDQAVVVS